MSNRSGELFPDRNPFSTSAVKPGAVGFHFRDGIDAAQLVTRLQQHGWRGEIVGPHGSGKSTLLRTLTPMFESAGREVRYYVARPNAGRFAISAADQEVWNASTLVIVEGYELLSRRQQRSIDKACRETQAGLLITCHQPQGFPTLLHTSVSIELAIAVVEQLLPSDCDFITSADVQASFARHGQNLRELLFEMYDLYEQRC